MAWLPNLWKSRDPETQQRLFTPDLPPVEHLEARLCLGSMHGASAADWAADEMEDLSQSLEIMQENGLSEVVEEHTSELPDPNDQPSIDHEVTTDNDVSPLVTGNINSPASATSPQLASTLQFKPFVDLNGAESNAVTDDAETAENIAVAPAVAAANGAGESTAAAGAVDQASAAEVSGRETSPTGTLKPWNTETLGALGLQLDSQGDAVGLAGSEVSVSSGYQAWWTAADEPVVIGYDFRSQGEVENVITAEQKALAEQALQRWSDATGGAIVFQHDTESAANRIINIGTGDLNAFGQNSGEGGVLGVGGGRVVLNDEGTFVASGAAWLDQAETWDTTVGNGDPSGTVDYSTVVSHEIGHALGYADTYGGNDDMMYGKYDRERPLSTIEYAVNNDYFYRTVEDASSATEPYDTLAITLADAQLKGAEVERLLRRAAAASASEDAIIAVVDRFGRILGVRAEADALAALPAPDTLVFAIDGAVAKARTAALFSNGNPENGTSAPLTSRTVRFISQSTVTQREVESNPNDDGTNAATAAASTTRGPGFVAPIGTGGHFPPEINFTPLVDLFAIEHTNRDSIDHPGPDGIRGTADDFLLRGRFNVNPAFVPAGNELFAPESYGHAQNSGLLPDAQSRGIATLPGGVPLFRDTNGDGIGDTLVGGIGVFFPGPDGFATHEQGFVAGIGQTERQRTNASRVLEAEFIALAAAGGSLQASTIVPGAKVGAINGVPPVDNLDLPFGRLDLVGLTLEVVGPVAGREGVRLLLEKGATLGAGDPASGDDQPLIGPDHRDGMLLPGETDPDGAVLVTPHGSGALTAADVQRIIDQGILAAKEVRAAVRLPLSSRTRMVFAVTDTTGEVLGLVRMRDATTFSIDVAVAKARNVAYYADAADLEAVDQVGTPGTAFTNRTFRFLAQGRYPSGINGTAPAPFSILTDDAINDATAENEGAPGMVSAFTSVLGNDAFFPMTNFRDPGDPGVMAAAGAAPLANQNGIVFFPGSTPIYKNGVLVGGFGVSGDGVDQDDVVTAVGATGFQAAGNATRADEIFVRGVRLPFQKFLRNPWG